MSAKFEHSDCELVESLQNGDRNAFKSIFVRYHKKLLFYTFTIVKSEGGGKDIVQETFIKLWETRQKLDPDQSLSGYLHVIARNLAFNHLKRAGYDRDLKKKV